MSDRVTITRTPGAQNVSFDTIYASVDQLVFWKNEDSEAHWPVFSTGSTPPSLTDQVGPHSTSDSLQPSLALATSPAQGKAGQVNYNCKLHAGETGTINVYLDFYSQPNQLPSATRGTAYSQPLTNGGLAPFTFRVRNSNLPGSLQVTIVQADQGPSVSGTPGSGDAGNFAFDLHCDDSAGNNVTQTYLLTVT